LIWGVIIFFPAPPLWKVTFLDTLRCIFEGKKSLFKGLDIYNQWDWGVTYPVIHISFGADVHKSIESLDKTII
jgi:hypothetical protein